MSSSRRHISRLGLSFGFLITMLAVVAVLGLLDPSTARGMVPVERNAVGLGAEKSAIAETSPVTEAVSEQIDTVNAAYEAQRESDAAVLAQVAERTITIKEPDPVVVFTAIDTDNPRAVEAASRVGSLDPLPDAPRVLPDVTEPGWQVGAASAYDLEDNDGWDATASGVKLRHDSVTVAVPLSQRHLMGSVVEIVYGDKVVVATVTDVGGFEKYGRVLDLAGGVWRAFGYGHVNDWGVQQVHYRFL